MAFRALINLYYGCLRGSPYKWLDLVELCPVLLPKHRVECIRYFTARVGARPGAAGQPIRQQLHRRALESLKPIVEIYYGHYLSHVVRMPLAYPPRFGSRFVEVIKTEEKGSDANLATHLIDENIPLETVRALRNAGHDVFARLSRLS